MTLFFLRNNLPSAGFNIPAKEKILFVEKRLTDVSETNVKHSES